ncbi:uncharacterized protein LOC143863585 [Tasmannia lanceolata]|uniref:uncharacterized protein LOC143863585 n=1 Tax=Tasmannia lanceolata TaxID=3420 RepID=UPI004063EC55
MDVWVVGAAACAGYIAKYWQNVFKEREFLSGSFVGNLTSEKSDSNTSLEKQIDQKRVKPGRSQGLGRSCSFPRRLRRQLGEEVTLSRDSSNSDEGFSDNSILDVPGTLANEMARTSGVDGAMLMNLGKYEEPNVLSLVNLQPHLFREENRQVDGDKVEGKTDFVDKSGYELDDRADILQPEQSPREIGISNVFGRGRSSLKSKLTRQYSVKPLSSLESCLIAQLYKEHVKTEEYVFTSLPSISKPTIRPFFITDGNQVISKSSNDALGVQFERGKCKLHSEGMIYFRERESVTGLLPLPEVGSIEPLRKLKWQRGNVQHGRSNISNMDHGGKHFHSQGSPDGMFLLCFGICIGMMSTILSKKREVEKLNESLKQAQNLVQDLHEELEMKDSLTVKELSNEACEFQEMDDHSTCIIDKISKEPQYQNLGENSMSKIEAELEAELERLELSMNGSCLRRRSTGLFEVDPDHIADIVHGELRVDTISRENDSDCDPSGISTTHQYPTNYSVSPKELSLRLHELIQSRLEERIDELETALQHSQKRLHLMEAERVKSPRDFSNSELESQSTQESPTPMEKGIGTAPPLFLNLSGDALNTYYEAYNEFARIVETEEEDPPVKENKQIDDIHLIDQNLFRGRGGGGRNGSLPHLEISKNLNCDEMRLCERISMSRGSNEASESEEEDDDEMGKLLIKQIVEKTRQGSPVVLNAQRMLFSRDE